MSNLPDPRTVEDLRATLRRYHGIIGILLARHGSAELSALTNQVIDSGGYPPWSEQPKHDGGVTLAVES